MSYKTQAKMKKDINWGVFPSRKGSRNSMPDVVLIPIKKIVIPSDYVRKDNNLGRIHGNIIYPVVVDKNFCLIDGSRRLEELTKRGVKNVKAIVMDFDTPSTRLWHSLILAFQREDLNPMEKSDAIAFYIKTRGNISMRQAARELGVSKSHIEDHMLLRTFSKSMQSKLRNKEMKMYGAIQLHTNRIQSTGEFLNSNNEKQYRFIMHRLSILDSMLTRADLTTVQLETIYKKLLGMKFMINGRMKVDK